MINDGRLCIKCDLPMHKAVVTYKELKLEARECPKCKDRIFTENLAMRAIAKLEAQRLEKEYTKHPIKIGNSWGITFPKEVVEIFSLGNPKTIVHLHPHLERNKIEIEVMAG